MAHKNLIDGTAYETKGGRCLVDGTGYDVKKGRTLVDGTGYDVAFEPESYSVTIVGSSNWLRSNRYVEIGGEKYYPSSDVTLDVAPGTELYCYVSGAINNLIMLDGTTVASSTAKPAEYTMQLQSNISISCASGTNKYGIVITTS